MPFFEPDRQPKFSIDYSTRQPVSVIAAFNPMGDFKPTHFGLTDLYGNRCKIQITGFKNTKDVSGGKVSVKSYAPSKF